MIQRPSSVSRARTEPCVAGSRARTTFRCELTMPEVKIEHWSRLKAQVSGERKMDRHEHRGGCHCGNLRWTLRSALSLIDLPVRTCGCDFCRKHGLLTTSDPLGELYFMLTDRQVVLRYRFGTE